MTAVYPVIHINNRYQARNNALACLEAGAAGVYLIHMGGQDELTLEVFNEVRFFAPQAFLGVNLLAIPTDYSLGTIFPHHLAPPDALWIDYMMPKTFSNPTRSKVVGGVAFKYTPNYTEDPYQAALEVDRLKSFVDVVCTSGPGTGFPPPIEKLQSMKQKCGEKPFAVASGVNSDNIVEMVGLVDQVLVGTFLEEVPGSGIINIPRLSTLISRGLDD